MTAEERQHIRQTRDQNKRERLARARLAPGSERRIRDLERDLETLRSVHAVALLRAHYLNTKLTLALGELARRDAQEVRKEH